MTAVQGIGRRLRPSWRQRVLRLLPWHRRLALLACLGVLGWAASGVLHPLMSNLQPRPAAFLQPADLLPLQGLQAPATVLGAAGLGEVQALRLLVLDGEPYYQARLPGAAEPRYWHARSGAPADLLARHAERLAQHYLGTTEPLRYAGSLSGFDGEYAFVNRLLPVARVDTAREDGLRLYLDLHQDRLGTLVDERKAWFGRLFQAVHSFRWLDGAGLLRPLLMSLLLAALLATAALGVALFLARPRQSRAPWRRRAHGWLGLLLALVTGSFAVSGGWHLWHKVNAVPLPAPFQPSYPVAGLDAAPQAGWPDYGAGARRLDLVLLDGAPAWRLEQLSADGMVGVRYLSGAGQALDDGAARRYGEQRLGHYAAALGLGQPQAVEVQERFDHDYGFVFKRLPVLRARYADGQRTALYVDPLDGALAARVADGDRAEGWSFAYLHKWEVLGRFGKPAKDVLVSGLALAHLLLAGLGLWLLRRRRPG